MSSFPSSFRPLPKTMSSESYYSCSRNGCVHGGRCGPSFESTRVRQGCCPCVYLRNQCYLRTRMTQCGPLNGFRLLVVHQRDRFFHRFLDFLHSLVIADTADDDRTSSHLLVEIFEILIAFDPPETLRVESFKSGECMRI